MSRAICTRTQRSARARRREILTCQAGWIRRAGADLPLGPEVVQLPAQLVDHPGARADQPLAMQCPAAESRAPGQPAARSGASRRPRATPRERSPAHRSDQTSRAHVPRGGRRPSVAAGAAPPSHRGQARTAQAHQRRAGHPRSPTPALNRACGPTPTAARTPRAAPAPSAARALHASPSAATPV